MMIRHDQRVWERGVERGEGLRRRATHMLNHNNCVAVAAPPGVLANGDVVAIASWVSRATERALTIAVDTHSVTRAGHLESRPREFRDVRE